MAAVGATAVALMGALLTHRARRIEAGYRPALQRLGDDLMQQDGAAILSTGMAGEVLEWNAGATRLFGHARETALRMNALSLFAEPERSRLEARMRSLPPGTAQLLEVQALRRNGDALDLQLSVCRVGSEGDARLIWHAMDMTARKHIERTVRQMLDAGYGRSPSEFLHFITEQLAHSLGSRYAFIARRNDDGKTARMISLWNGEKLLAPFDYSLEQTPCSEISGRDLVCYSEQVADRFPHDSFLRRQGIQAYLAVALCDTRGQVLGHMGVMHNAPLQAVEQSATVLRIFSSRAAAELQRLRADESMAHRLAMEALLADLSSSFVAVEANEFDQRVEAALERIARFAGVERGHLYRCSADQGAATLTHLWTAPNIGSMPQSYRELNSDQFPWHWAQMHGHGFVLISDVEELPADAAHECDAMQRAGIRSMLEVGIYAGPELIGFLGLESLQRKIHWPAEDLRMLRVVGEVIANAFERLRHEQSLRKLSSALAQTADAVMITDREGIIEFVNPAFEHISGYTRAEVLGRTPGLLRSGRHERAFFADLWATVLRGDVFRSTIVNRRRDGSLYHEQKSITPLKDEHGAVTHFVATGRDITEQVQAQEHLLHLAQHDVLTDLPNRSLFMDRTSHAIARARRTGSHVGLLFLDLDGFKEVNDSLGHDAGDDLLRLVADRLRAAVREGDTVSRLGGDEFTILLEGIERPDDAAAVAQKIIAALAQPYSIDGAVRHVSASVGISFYPADGEQAEALLHRADQAMFEAKRQTGGSYCFSDRLGAR